MSDSLLAAFAAGSKPIDHRPPPGSIRRHTIEDADDTLSSLDDTIILAVTTEPGRLAAPQIYARCSHLADDRSHIARSLARLVRLGHITFAAAPDVPPGQRPYRPAGWTGGAEKQATASSQGATTKSSDPKLRTTHTMATKPKVISHTDVRSAAECVARAATQATDEDQVPAGHTDEENQRDEHAADEDQIPAENVREKLDPSSFDEPIGPTLGFTRSGHLTIDLPVLMRTRMLVTAASGGGKSWAVRRILEETAPLVQQIVIDPEGEFDTLAECFPYSVFNDRDTKVPLSQCSPYALAQELVKTRISAVIDISDFETEERHHFVARFIKGLMKLPKEHWHHVMIVLDESHIFAPQQDRSEAKKPVIDLACRGRKRGYCAILATNRLSLLNKSVASEMQNRLIGQTGLDTDLKRAADELGMGRLHTIATLTNLDPGNFMAYGPALTRTVQRVAVGPVRTTHGVQLGAVQAPATASAELLDAIFATVKEMPEDKAPENEEEGASDRQAKEVHEEAQRFAARAQIAAQRLAILSPILATEEGAPRAKAIKSAAATAGLSSATIYLWLQKYDPADPEGSLAPSRIPRNATGKAAVPPNAPAAHPVRAPRKKVIRLKPPAAPSFTPFQRLKLQNAGLPERHIQVLEKLQAGLPQNVIAEDLGISLDDLKGYLQLSTMLLGAANIAQLATELNFVDPSSCESVS